tara:strand:- start:27 stop:884 length:858 start_codon:yes stop_codon:yes gene_type:complete
MKNMKKPKIDQSCIDIYKDIVKSKRKKEEKDILKSLEGCVETRYTEYEYNSCSGDLYNLSQNNSLLEDEWKSELLKSCYKSNPKTLQFVKDSIESEQIDGFLTVCPYCGIGDPKTYDHYLPKSKFPELSVHAFNLFPCCGTCNQTKSSNWKNEEHRTFINLYSDKIPESQYLFVKLIEDYDSKTIAANFFLQKPDEVDDNLWKIIESHYLKLGLLKKYKNRSDIKITSLINSCKAHIETGGSNIPLYIDKLLQHDKDIHGYNYWVVILYKTLSESEFLLELLKDI